MSRVSVREMLKMLTKVRVKKSNEWKLDYWSSEYYTQVTIIVSAIVIVVLDGASVLLGR